MTVILLVGGTGNIGKVITNELLKHTNKFKVVVVTRNPSDTTAAFESAGATIVKYDLSAPTASAEEIKTILEKYKVNIILSFVATSLLLKQKLLVNAAMSVQSVSVISPSLYGFDEGNVSRTPLDSVFEPKIEVLNYIKQAHKQRSDLHWFGVHTGAFTDWLMTMPILGIYQHEKKVVAPGSKKSQLTTTTMKDIGNIVVRIVEHAVEGDPSVTDKELHIGSDTVTYEAIHKALEEASGESFQFEEKPVDEFKQVHAKETAAGNKMNATFAAFNWLAGEQKGVYWPIESTWNKTHASDIQTQSVAEWLKAQKK